MSGIGTRKLKLEIDGDEYTAEVSKAVFTSGDSDSDFVTFAEAAAGGKRDYRLAIIGVQDAATGSFWDLVWSHAGETVPVTVMPYGNDVPSAGEPHFTADCVISEPDGDFLGGEANKSSSARFTIEVSWQCEAKPEKVTA